MRSSNGVADIIGLLPSGRFLAIEVKVKGNKQSTDQKDFQVKIEKNNGVYMLAYSLSDVIKGIEALIE